jgi:hypothetical protein
MAKGKKAGRRLRALAGAMGIMAMAGTALAFPANAQQKLELERALPLDGTALARPAGLAWDGKRLLMVCAVHDDDIYAIELQADKAAFKEAIRIRRPKEAEGMKMGWRGITVGKDGSLYLAAEQACRILKVEGSGEGEWFGPALLEAGAEKGLFAGNNSGLEGLAQIGPRKFLVAAAREPRGLLEVDLSGKSPLITAWVADKTRLSLAAGRRRPDFADMIEDQGKIWALCANSDAICQIKRNGNEVVEGETWSYAQVAEDPKYKFTGLRMGLARGLAMDGQSIYIALDNKGVGRQADQADKRPLLLVFKRPHGV